RHQRPSLAAPLSWRSRSAWPIPDRLGRAVHDRRSDAAGIRISLSEYRALDAIAAHTGIDEMGGSRRPDEARDYDRPGAERARTRLPPVGAGKSRPEGGLKDPDLSLERIGR